MVKANYHSHLKYCNHAKGHARDYIEVAIKAGFQEIGISDHAPMLEVAMGQNYKYQKPMLLDVFYKEYLPELKEAKAYYKDRIKVLAGVETEYLSSNAFFLPILRRNLDYLNLGVHFFEFDNQILSSYASVNSKTIYGYLDACIKGMETGLFNTLVHPDLFMVSYQNEKKEKIFDEHCQYVSEKIIECAIKNNVYLEINANGINNSKRFSDGKNWVYPNEEFWKIVKKYKDAKIIIGSDAHSPDALVCSYVEEAEAFAKRLNLKVSELMEIHH